jgi:hypothetical protein
MNKRRNEMSVILLRNLEKLVSSFGYIGVTKTKKAVIPSVLIIIKK